MSFSEAIDAFIKETGMTQDEIAKKMHLDRTYISKVKNGKAKLNEAHYPKLSGISWKIANCIADKYTGGYISNRLEDCPNMDLHPSALKEMLMKDLEEAKEELEELLLAKHIDTDKRKEQAKRVWHELRDVDEVSRIMQGVLEDYFGLDRSQLVKEHELQVKKGER